MVRILSSLQNHENLKICMHGKNNSNQMIFVKANEQDSIKGYLETIKKVCTSGTKEDREQVGSFINYGSNGEKCRQSGKDFENKIAKSKEDLTQFLKKELEEEDITICGPVKFRGHVGGELKKGEIDLIVIANKTVVAFIELKANIIDALRAQYQSVKQLETLRNIISDDLLKPSEMKHKTIKVTCDFNPYLTLNLSDDVKTYICTQIANEQIEKGSFQPSEATKNFARMYASSESDSYMGSKFSSLDSIMKQLIVFLQ